MYRNDIREVARFFATRHYGENNASRPPTRIAPYALHCRTRKIDGNFVVLERTFFTLQPAPSLTNCCNIFAARNQDWFA
jgi:hypothetical protein